jgi:uncharacterized protein YndB with AHSA1/START domain
VTNQITLVVRRTIKAEASRVFDAWTKPEHLLEWWGPRPVICTQAEVDLRVGGSYRIANLLPDGTTLWICGQFELVERPSRLVYSWRIEPTGASAPEVSRVTVRFEAHGAATEVIVLHERIDTEATRSDHEQGWHGCLDNLASLFSALFAD